MKNALLGALMALVLSTGFAGPSLAKDTCGPNMCKKCIKLCTNNLASFKKKGGKYAEPARIKLMEDCLAACKKREKDSSPETAKACGEVCKKCAASCEELKDASLKDCIAACNSCADSCTK